MEAILDNSHTPGVNWGVEVAELTNGTPVFKRNSHHLFTPASCTKLFTAAMVLDLLGSSFCIDTPLDAVGEIDAKGTLKGDLVWKGRGAPDLGRPRNATLEQTLAPLVDGIAQAGIRRVTGAVVADESYFRSPPYGPGWNWDDLADATGAPISALTVHDNVARVVATPTTVGAPIRLQIEPFPQAFGIVNHAVTAGAETTPLLRFERLPGSRELLVIGSLPARNLTHEERLALPNPAMLAATALQEALVRRGIVVEQGSRVVHDPATNPRPARATRTVATIRSAPLGELVRNCLKPSQNLHAQLLWLLAGAEFESRSRATTLPSETDGSTQTALRQFLGRLSLGGNDFFFEEGSGLSRKNLVSPFATISLLRHLHLHPRTDLRDAWLSALPVGGVDGTLKNRFTQSPTLGNVRAKTGSLRNIHALAGYVDTAGGHRLAFAIFANGFATADPSISGREQIDRLVELLAAYKGAL
jgi:D-alanyl-D-alanine carboxypeptidase/D-alanyl-D-alanine-endopeptidase (penicillin-binding protein 4)